MNIFMRQAIEEAREGIINGHGGPFGAVIVKDNEVIAKAHNQVLLTNDPTMHAEIAAIRLASEKLQTYDLKGSVIYTTGEPCPMCLSAILWANIDKIYYGCNINDTEKIGFRDNKFYQMLKGSEQINIEEIDREETLKLYKEYLDKTDKILY